MESNMLKKCLDWAVYVMVAAGAAALLFQVFLTTADVCLRYFFNAPITSSYELSEIIMGIIGPVALLYCAYDNGHVCVDILHEKLPSWAQGFSRILSNLIVLVCAGLLAWQAWYQIKEVMEMGISSPMLQLPMWPVACVFLACFLVFIPIAIRNIFRKGDEK